MLCVVPSVCGTSPSLHASLPPLLQPHWLFAVSGTYQRVFRLRDLYILFFLLKFSSLVYLFVFLVFCSNLTLSMRLALSTLYNTAAWTHLPHPVLFLLRNTYHILTYFIILPFFFFFLRLFAFGLPCQNHKLKAETFVLYTDRWQVPRKCLKCPTLNELNSPSGVYNGWFRNKRNSDGFRSI